MAGVFVSPASLRKQGIGVTFLTLVTLEFSVVVFCDNMQANKRILHK